MDDTLFKAVVSSLGYLTDDEDVLRRAYAKYRACYVYLLGAGAKKENLTAENAEAVETIAIGVNDLMNGMSGKTEFSPAFRLLSMHLASIGVKKEATDG